ncbi:MAG: hypothetical protein KGJ62_01310 [Armatimonadetes bacterium]|nr:hypothetical protein [Armatimonadota bacterium]MDE2205857.1 hypothetical protein [Armatimonadota bacterium]
MEVLAEMWARGGATPEVPRPFLRTSLCRLLTIALVDRSSANGQVKLNIRTLPAATSGDQPGDEASILSQFLRGVGQYQPQLVGFNSFNSDLLIIRQRAIALGVAAPAFCRRPEKPWEGPDYFRRDNDCNIDLMELLTGGAWDRGTRTSLSDMARISGIPGKMGTDGDDVAELWLQDRIGDILNYNVFDALTTYLLWLQVAHFGGHFTTDEWHEEHERLEALITSEIESGARPWLQLYLDEWRRLRSFRTQFAAGMAETQAGTAEGDASAAVGGVETTAAVPGKAPGKKRPTSPAKGP